MLIRGRSVSRFLVHGIPSRTQVCDMLRLTCVRRHYAHSVCLYRQRPRQQDDNAVAGVFVAITPERRGTVVSYPRILFPLSGLQERWVSWIVLVTLRYRQDGSRTDRGLVEVVRGVGLLQSRISPTPAALSGRCCFASSHQRTQFSEATPLFDIATWVPLTGHNPHYRDASTPFPRFCRFRVTLMMLVRTACRSTAQHYLSTHPAFDRLKPPPPP